MDDPSEFTETKGIITGQRDSYIFRNIKFAHFFLVEDEENSTVNDKIAAIGTCSHCPGSQDDDGFVNTIKLEGLTFNNVKNRLLYHENRRTILHNPDGSLLQGN